jgi:type I restriction enzyme S subunit
MKAGWQMVKFGEIAENIAIRVKPAEAGSDIYVGLEHLDPESLHLRKWGHPSDVEGDKLRFWKGDIIFGRRRAYQRKLAVADFDGICSAHAMVLRAKPKIILPEFLPFFLRSDMFMERAIGISVGSLSPTINWKTLREEKFPLFPLDEQKRIAEILWAADMAEGKYKKTLESLSSLSNHLLREAIEHSPPQLVECSMLFKNPPRNGYSPKTNAIGNGWPTLSIGAIRDGHVNTNGTIKYAEISPEELDQFRLRTGDILVVRGNGNKELCGKAGLVDSFPHNCFYPDLLIRIEFDEEKILPAFAVSHWNDPHTHRRLISRAKSTNGIWKVNGKDLRQHKLFVPPLEVQRETVQRLSAVRRRESEISHHIEHLQSIKRTITNNMFGTAAYGHR